MEADSPERSSRLEEWIERSELPMLVLAALSVAVYLADLKGVFASPGLQGPVRVVALLIDLTFVLDFCVKVAVLRSRYLLTPWALIDVVSSLPILSSVAIFPRFVDSLRFVRGFRLFRVLRSLRSLRTLRVLRGVGALRHQADRDEASPALTAFHRALSFAVLAYSSTFLVLVVVSGGDADTEFDLVLGSLLGMGVVLVVVRYQMQEASSRQVRALLNVALPLQVAEHFVRHPESYDRTVSGPATICFSDFVGFTDSVGKIGDDLDTLKEHLERTMDVIVEAHVRWDLIVDKFIGDAVMSFRGGDLVQGTEQDHAWRVVRASLDAMAALRQLDDPYFNRIKVGGASTRSALIGTFGTSQRLSYTVLGTKVNVAARLEAACARLAAGSLFCDRTHTLLAGRADLAWRRAGRLALAGVAEPQLVYEAFLAEDVTAEWLALFETALVAFEAGRFADATLAFTAADAQRPGGDGPSRVYLAECAAMSGVGGVPEGWTGTLQARK